MGQVKGTDRQAGKDSDSDSGSGRRGWQEKARINSDNLATDWGRRAGIHINRVIGMRHRRAGCGSQATRIDGKV